jgi:hypothetical protein
MSALPPEADINRRSEGGLLWAKTRVAFAISRLNQPQIETATGRALEEEPSFEDASGQHW